MPKVVVMGACWRDELTVSFYKPDEACTPTTVGLAISPFSNFPQMVVGSQKVLKRGIRASSYYEKVRPEGDKAEVGWTNRYTNTGIS